MTNFFEELEKVKHFTKLNLGCGKDNILDDYLNVDIRDIDDERVYRHDVRSLPFELNHFDEIIAIDIYEHIPYKESKQLLEHWISLLKPGGVIYIQTPCLPFIIQRLLANPQMPVNIQTWEMVVALIFGGQDYPENYHYTITSPELLHDYLREAGITGEIQFQERGVNIMMRAYK